MLLIAALCLAPFVAAWIAYYFMQPGPAGNYGELIPARPLADPPLRHLDGRAFRLSELKGKWIMLQLDRADCAQACRAKLYGMRQVRLAQGREMERIERVWLILDDAPLDTVLMREYDGTRMLRAGGSSMLGEFPAAGGVNEHIYLIDPLGNLMLRFPRNADPDRIRKDLARLLRVSRIG
jgi:cytochrome oxidase Cu insertion factor (SCO1/SenC/PrrC family)